MPQKTYQIIELVGVSANSWEEAAQNALESAIRKLEEVRIAEVVKSDVVIENGTVAAFRILISLSFKYIDSWWLLKEEDY